MNSNFAFEKRNLFGTWLWLVCLGLISEHSFAGDFLGQSSLTDVLPETTQMVLVSQSVQSSYAVLEQTDICKQLSSPLWQNVVAKQKGAKVGSILNPQPWLGLDWQDIRAIDQVGAVAAFLDSNGETAVVFLAKLGPNADKHPFVQRWLGNQGGLNQFQSIPVTEPTRLLALKGDGKAGLSACIAFGSQWTCISSATKAVQQWLATPTLKSMKAAAAPGLAQTVFESTNWGNGETRFWLSPWAILNGYAKSDPKLFRSAKLFGMEGLAALSGTLTPPSTSEKAWRLAYSQQLATPLSKGLAALSFKTGPLVDPPKILNEGMDQVAISYLDMKPWFQGVSHAVDQMIDEDTPGNFADLIDSILTDPEGPKIDVRKELIYPSGPLMFSFGTTGPDKKKAGQFQHSQVWACLVPDAKKASTIIDKLFENDKDIKTEQIGQYRVWNTVNDESLFVAVSKGETQSVTVAAIDSNYLYLSTDTNWLKAQLAGTAQATKPGQPALWKSYVQQLKPSVFSTQQAVFLGSWFERSWARLPEPTQKAYSSVDLPAFCLTKVLVPGCVLSDVPKWNQVQPAFGVLTQTAVQNERGIDGQIWLYAKP